MGAETFSERQFQPIFIMLDHLTKFVLMKALPNANTKNVIKFLIPEVLHKLGTSETIIADNGKQFVSICSKYKEL